MVYKCRRRVRIWSVDGLVEHVVDEGRWVVGIIDVGIDASMCGVLVGVGG